MSERDFKKKKWLPVAGVVAGVVLWLAGMTKYMLDLSQGYAAQGLVPDARPSAVAMFFYTSPAGCVAALLGVLLLVISLVAMIRSGK